MSLEETTISKMWEIAALVEVLERKGLCTKQDLLDILVELRGKSPRAKSPETAFPSPCLLSHTEENVIDGMFAVMNRHGIVSTQALELLDHMGRIIEMGTRMTRGTTH